MFHFPNRHNIEWGYSSRRIINLIELLKRLEFIGWRSGNKFWPLGGCWAKCCSSTYGRRPGRRSYVEGQGHRQVLVQVFGAARARREDQHRGMRDKFFLQIILKWITREIYLMNLEIHGLLNRDIQKPRISQSKDLVQGPSNFGSLWLITIKFLVYVQYKNVMGIC